MWSKWNGISTILGITELQAMEDAEIGQPGAVSENSC